MAASSSTPEKDQQEIAQLMQIRAIYQLTTDITKNCFETCLPKLTPRMEDSERNCLSNCAANFLRMKMLYTRRLIESAKTISASISENNSFENSSSGDFE
jgi:hypothetical protein